MEAVKEFFIKSTSTIIKKSEYPGLSVEQLKEYDKNGYLIVKGLFNQEIVNDLSDTTNKLKEFTFNHANSLDTRKINDLKTSPGSLDIPFYHQGTQFVLRKLEDSYSIARIVWAGATAPNILEHSRDGKLLTSVSQILKSPYADHLINQIHYKMPHDKVDFGVHQDVQNRKLFNDHQWADMNGRGSYVVAITAIDKITKENGPLKVIPASHIYGELDFPRMMKPEEFQAQYKNSLGFDVINDAHNLLMEPGDTVFISPYTIHYSLENLSNNNERKVLINGYSFPGVNTKQYPGDGSAKLIRIDPNFNFRDFIFGASIFMKTTGSLLDLVKFYHQSTPANAMKLLDDLSQIVALHSGPNLISNSLWTLNVVTNLIYSKNYLCYDPFINIASMSLVPVLNNLLVARVLSPLTKAILPNEVIPYLGLYFGITMACYNAYELFNKVQDFYAYLGLTNDMINDRNEIIADFNQLNAENYPNEAQLNIFGIIDL